MSTTPPVDGIEIAYAPHWVTDDPSTVRALKSACIRRWGHGRMLARADQLDRITYELAENRGRA